MVRVCVAGSTGWTGSAVAAAIEAADDLELVAGVSRSGGTHASVAEALDAVETDVVVDFTSAEAVKANVLAALERKVAVVVGSSGLTADDYAEIDRRAREAEVGVIAAGNFSILAATLLRISREAARQAGAWEIIDYASAKKPDVPSGTARELAEQLGEVRQPALGREIDTLHRPHRGTRRNGGRLADPLGAAPELRRLHGDRLRGARRAALDPPRRGGEPGAVRRRDAPGRARGRRPRRAHPRPRRPARLMLLNGVRVVACEIGLAGPLCTRLLADLGADVVKVEAPEGGDVTRGWDTIANGVSSAFVWVNRGKRSVAIDVREPANREEVERLVASADVFLQNFAPGWAERVGLDEPTVRALRPDVVYVDISGYGPDGPYAHRNAYDLIVQGETGLMSITGTAEEPARLGVSGCDLSTGSYAAVATLAALVRRGQTGEGAHVQISLFDVALDWLGYFPHLWWHREELPPRTGLRHPLFCPYGPLPAADRLVLGRRALPGSLADVLHRRARAARPPRGRALRDERAASSRCATSSSRSWPRSSASAPPPSGSSGSRPRASRSDR